MAHPFAPFEPPATAAGDGGVNGTRINGMRVDGNGHRTPGVGLGEDQVAESAVARLIRRQVAERMTEATRAADNPLGTPMPDPQRERLIRQFITDALDAYATEGMRAGASAPGGCSRG